jgi:hypothetical protein
MPAQLNGAFPFVPMQWNDEGIASLATYIANDNASIILGFNEPDNAGQANMSPSVAATCE